MEGVEEEEYNKLKHHDGNNSVLILVNSNKGKAEVSPAKTKSNAKLLPSSKKLESELLWKKKMKNSAKGHKLLY